jgi:hypothetical protein
MTTFTMEPQQLDQWCWAAVAVSVTNYIKPNSAPSQCDLAARALGVAAGCRGNAPPPACDQPYSLNLALNDLSRQLGNHIVGPVSFAKIKQTIDGGWPIPVRIVWDDHPANGHFVVITGYHVSPNGIPRLQVDDPFYDRSIVDYNTLVSSYKGSGSWERTYVLV